jgi:hypothetical protein
LGTNLLTLSIPDKSYFRNELFTLNYIDLCFLLYITKVIFIKKQLIFQLTPVRQEPSRPWSYGSWIYNYLCYQCLSPLTLLVQIPLMARCTPYIMWKSLSVTCKRSVVFSWYSGSLHQINWLPRYSWNIVESGVKHHNPDTIFSNGGQVWVLRKGTNQG